MITIADEEIREEKEVCRWNSNIVDLIYTMKRSEIPGKERKRAKVLEKNTQKYFFLFNNCFYNF